MLPETATGGTAVAVTRRAAAAPRSAFATAAVLRGDRRLFLGLGVWQVQRRAWKLDLIARVDARLAADPVAAPGPAAWAGAQPRRRRLRPGARATGRFLHDREVAVLAVTDLGSGYWMLTPLETPDFTVLVNRGFVPPDRRDPATRPEGQVAGEVTVTGLLRLSEPGGGFLRANDPAAGRWYSRDVAAIAAAQGLRGAGRALLHRRRRSAEPRRPAGRGTDGRPFPQRPPQLRADLVRPRRRPRLAGASR